MQLVLSARDGDATATEELLRRHYDRVAAVCRRIVGNDADADDATQEALIAIVRGLPRFEGQSQFSTWAYRVAANAALDELRRQRRRPVAAEPLETADSGARALDEDVADRLSIDGAVARLAPDFRAAVVLRDQCGLEYTEIAALLHVPIGTVRSRIARGRAALVPLLAPGNSGALPGRPTE